MQERERERERREERGERERERERTDKFHLLRLTSQEHFVHMFGGKKNTKY